MRLRSDAGLPLIYLPGPNRAEGGTFGLGDAEVSGFWSPRKTGSALLGVGPIVRIPLATDTRLGSGKWSAGVTAAAIARPRGELVGFRTDNLWSFAGDGDRPDVNQFYFQYFVVRSLGGGWYVLSVPALTANWNVSRVRATSGAHGWRSVSSHRGWLLSPTGGDPRPRVRDKPPA